jgi:hypothetical protein
MVENDVMTAPVIKTQIRRSHLGNRYDIYINGAYRATAYKAREIEPLIEQLTSK